MLVGGSPGIGKSTILLQMCGKIASDKKILYVSGEESERQLKLRANRLGVNSSSIFVFSETDISSIVNTVSETQPDVLIIDSIQTVSDYDNDSAPGVSQGKAGGAYDDALAALAMLGYSTADVAPVLRQISTENMTSEQIIRAVLKFMV